MKSDSGFDRFLRYTHSGGIQLDTVSIEMLKEYVASLLSWNSRINLVSRSTNADEVWLSHILHSVSPLSCVDIPGGSRLLDIGSGGGLPGIPLAIARRDLDVTLMDSIAKKTAALEDMVHQLGLPNVTVVTGRVEEQRANPALASNFDVITARAVAPLTDLIGWAIPFADCDAAMSVSNATTHTPFLLAMKGGDLGEEMNQARAKWSGLDMSVRELKFDGFESAGLEDKKVVVVQLRARQPLVAGK